MAEKPQWEKSQRLCKRIFGGLPGETAGSFIEVRQYVLHSLHLHPRRSRVCHWIFMWWRRKTLRTVTPSMRLSSIKRRTNQNARNQAHFIYIYCYPRRLKFCHNIKESTLNWAWPSCYIVKSGALFRAFATSLLFTGTLPLFNHYVCIKRARSKNIITLYWR